MHGVVFGSGRKLTRLVPSSQMNFKAIAFWLVLLLAVLAGVAGDIWLWKQVGWRGVAVMLGQRLLVEPVVEFMAIAVLG